MKEKFNTIFNKPASSSVVQGSSSHDEREVTPYHLTIDWSLYESYLQDSDWPDDQKREFIETIWQIVVMFVDLGFGIESGQLALREALERARPAADDEPEGGAPPPSMPAATREGDRE